jgi:phage terminase large subunit GpA-like protein
MKFKHSAIGIIAGVMASVLTPAEIVQPSVWASQNVVVPDGPYKGQLWQLDRTPYFAEILDFWSSDCPDNKLTFRKSKQIGATTLAIAACGYTIDVEPCDVFLIEPTDSNLADFNSEKLQRTLDASPRLAKKVFPQTARSGQGSTTYAKRFRGGSILMGIATSTADLRGKTRQKVIRDESSEYPRDLDGQGSPHEMIAGAYGSFLATGDYKDLDISTPVVKGECHIDEEFEKGDQRYWHVKCPGCTEEFYFTFDRKLFRFNDSYPFNAHYVAPCCGQVIEAHERDELVRNGRWIATLEEPGRHRSYHFDALSSPFVPWDVVAERAIAAKDDPAKQKTFDNLTLGIAHEIRGDAPDHVRLLERREEYARGIVPPAGLLLTCGVDVQHSGLWFEVVAWASDKQSWSVDHGWIPGDTTDHKLGAWAALQELYERKFDDSFNGLREIDLMFVDAGDGGRANQVYSWCRGRHRAFAIKGVPGWHAPAIGTPAQVDITQSGKKIKKGATLWPIGGWSLKATFYTNLNKDGRKADQLVDPPGYCHYHKDFDEVAFKQVTAEYLVTVTRKGRSFREWKESGANHLLDCRVYAMAAADYLGMNRMTEDQWKQLAQLRGVPAVLQTPDLVAPAPVKIAAGKSKKDQPAPPREVRPALLGRKKKAVRRVRGRW